MIVSAIARLVRDCLRHVFTAFQSFLRQVRSSVAGLTGDPSQSRFLLVGLRQKRTQQGTCGEAECTQ
jgi:hypothetical protein